MSKRLCGIRNFVLSPDERLLGIVAVYPYNIVSNADDEFHKKNGPQTAGAPIVTKRADDAGPSYVFSHDEDAQIQLFRYEERVELIYVDLAALQPTVVKVFNKSLHNSSILSMTCCSNKSMIGVVSKGNQMKFWSHTNDWKSLANFDFREEQPICIDLHPSGF